MTLQDLANFIKEIGFPAFAFVAILVLYWQAQKERRTVIKNNTDAITRLTNMIARRDGTL